MSATREVVTVSHPASHQGITLWLGDGQPIHIDDLIDPSDLVDLIPAPLQRTVAVARLKAVVLALRRAEAGA